MPDVFRSRRLVPALIAVLVLFLLPTAVHAAVPTVSSISPVNGSLGQTVSVTLTGTGFSAGGAFVNVTGNGVGVTNVVVNSDTSITATFTIVASTGTGGRGVSVTTTGGTSTNVNFQVLGAPTLTSISTISPTNTLTIGAAYALTVSGTNYAATTASVTGTSINISGSGITVDPPAASNTTASRTFTVRVASNAAAGPRNVTVTTAAGTTAPIAIKVSTNVAPGYLLSTFAGQDVITENGLPTAQPLPVVNDVALDSIGNLYLAAGSANKVYKITTDLQHIQHISTFAGTGALGSAGDGLAATAAQLTAPVSVVADSQKNIYIAEVSEIRKVSAADGTISTFAGRQGAALSGNNGSALFAQFENLTGLSIDSHDNLYVLDNQAQLIRKITPAGAITTVAGNGISGYTGDGGPATQASLGLDQQTTKLAIDSFGNIYFPDSDNGVIRMVAASNGFISTITPVGQGFNGFSFPTAVALDSSNPSQIKLLVVDTGKNVIEEITGTTTISSGNSIATVAGSGSFLFNGDGTATTVNLSNPVGGVLDGSGNLYFVDSLSNRIRQFSSLAVTPSITTLAGNSGVFGGDNGPATSAQFSLPQSISIDPADNLFIADTANVRVRKVSSAPGNTTTTIAGNGTFSLTVSGDGGPAISATLGIPWAVAATSSGVVYIAESTTLFGGTDSRIWKVGLDNNITTVAGGSTSGPLGDNGAATAAQLNNPLGVVVDQNTGSIYIADTCNFRIRKVDVFGVITTYAGIGTQGYSGDGGPALSAQLGSPRQLALDSSGNLYIADRGSNDSRCNGNVQGLSQRIWKVTPGGTISTVTTFAGTGVAASGSNLFAASNSFISQIFPDGGGGVIAGASTTINGLSGDGAPATANLISADELAVNSQGAVFFVDPSDNVVRKLTPQVAPVVVGVPNGIAVRGGTSSFTSVVGVGVWGSATATWNATVSTMNGGNWLSISPSTGTGTGFGTLTATYNVSNITPACSSAPCFYNGSITFTTTPAAANSSFTVPVTLTIMPENITAAPPSFFAAGTVGGFIPPLTVSVANSGLGGSFNFTATSNSPWLSVSPLSPALGNSATAPFVTVSYNTTGLSAGINYGGITISSTDPNVVNSPVTIPITLFLNPAIAGGPPFLSTISPANGALGQQSVAVTLTGGNFLMNPTVTVSGNNNDVTVSSVTAVNASTITATFNISAGAALGNHNVTVTTAGGGPSNSQIFTILAAPTLTSISPPFGNPGTTVSATLTGTNFTNSGMTVSVSGTGVTANLVTSTNTNSRNVLLTIASNAPTGPRSVTVSTAAGTSGAVTFAVAPDSGSGYLISTIAGLDVVHENQAATNQPLPFFFDVARDSNGNLYIASQNANKVYKVSGGNISTFAGTGTPGPGGDGGLATSAQLNQPRAVVVDASNNVYIADAGNNRVRVVSAADGTIKTAAGTGAAGYSGDGSIAKFAQLNAPSGLGIDSAGAIYINDLNNHRIRKADPSTGIVTTVAGNGTAGYNGDGGQAILARLNLDSQTTKLAIDGAGNLYIPDALNNRVRMVAANGTISTFAGTGLAGFSGDNGQANAAMLNTPRAVAFDNNGNLYISDSNNNRIRRVSSGGGISTVAGNGFNGFNGDGTATAQQLTAPIGLITDSSANVYFADSGSNRLREVSGGALSTLAGNSGVFGGDGAAASSAPLYNPGGVALYPPTGALLIADSRDYRGRFVVLQPVSGFVVGDIYTGAGNGNSAPGPDGVQATSTGIGFANDVFADTAGNVFFSANNKIRIITPDGFINTFAGTGAPGYNGQNISATSAQLNIPQGMTMDAAGNLYIADSNNQLVRMVSNTWSYNSTTHVLTPGTITNVAGTPGSAGSGGDGASATAAQLNNPRRLAFDANADTYGAGKLYIADNNNSKIRVVDSGGIINTFSTFGGNAVAYSSGNLYIASGSQIQRWFPDGSFATVAGNGFGISGDNGPALMAALSVSGLAAAADGTIYVADSSDNVVRKLAPVADGSAVLSASPLGFNLRMSNNSSSTQTIPISIVPDVAFNWSATANVTTPAGSEWLSISGPSSGTGSSPLSVLVNASALTEGGPGLTGIYNGSVTITSPQAVNGSITIPFTLTVLPSTLSASVSSFTPVATACNSGCSNFSSPNFTVSNSGSDANFPFTATASVVSPPGGNWLSVAPAGSTTGSGLNFSATYNVTGLPPGIYTGNIILTAAAASNSPLELPVTLTINPTGGPTLTSITPSSGSQGQTVNVILTGTNFSPSMANPIAISGSGVAVSNFAFLSGTSYFATLSISSTATSGGYNVTVNNGQGISPGVTFTVGPPKKRPGQITSQ